MAADALDPCVTMISAAIVLNREDKVELLSLPISKLTPFRINMSITWLLMPWPPCVTMISAATVLNREDKVELLSLPISKLTPFRINMSITWLLMPWPPCVTMTSAATVLNREDKVELLSLPISKLTPFRINMSITWLLMPWPPCVTMTSAATVLNREDKVELLSLPISKLTPFRITMSIKCLLMPWRLVSPWYQQPQYWTERTRFDPLNKNTLETCKNPRPTAGWSELTKSCTTSTMNFQKAYFSRILQNNARLKLSCKIGESKCNPYWHITLTTSYGMDYVLNEHLDFIQHDPYAIPSVILWYS